MLTRRRCPQPARDALGRATLTVGDCRRLLRPAAAGRVVVLRRLDRRLGNERFAALALEALAGHRASRPASCLAAAVALAVGWGDRGDPSLAALREEAPRLVAAACRRG